jgi:hypothetical protein
MPFLLAREIEFVCLKYVEAMPPAQYKEKKYRKRKSLKID